MATTTPEEQFGQILVLLDENSKGIANLKQSMEEMKEAKVDFNVLAGKSVLTENPNPDPKSAITNKATDTTHLGPSSCEASSEPSGHHYETHHHPGSASSHIAKAHSCFGLNRVTLERQTFYLDE